MNIRKAVIEDAYSIAAVQVNSWRTTYRGIVSDAYLSNMSIESREQVWRGAISPEANTDLRFIYVAEDDGGEVVGFAMGGPNRSKEFEYEGELYAIYLLEHVQGQGIGANLVNQIVHDFIEHGIHSMLVWVLRGNKALGFYERMGGQMIGSKTISIGEEEHEELALGWKELRNN
ncbi:GNAT family N-acetyltransferase [Paenibacillus sediminis]|uniref:GNAT superfamily N-acetyltransferase n=1 Tax=Paenibacillus sediminis TaxID=664909 RepID=A0ABS4H2F2_9BACL|nr:GNAT family N-acetyltransferase [Paenibacillus sediminis]MBP1936295.1 GNAT superfamily N-acetyltransferase [Paenibacillus sediminis]